MTDYAIERMISHWIHVANQCVDLEWIHKALFSQVSTFGDLKIFIENNSV